MENFPIVNKHFCDLNPLIFGEEECKPGHSFGPAIRSYVLIHFVLSGEGTLYKNEKEIKVSAGEAFIICPGEITTYTASLTDPWHYLWIGFDGTLAKNFSAIPVIFRYRKRMIDKIYGVAQNNGMREYKLAAILFELYSELFASEKPSKSYVDAVKDYIAVMYMQSITVEDIARQLSLDRRYLSHLFKKNTGLTPREYKSSITTSETGTSD